MSPDEVRHVLAEADCLFDRDTVERAIDDLAAATSAVLAEENPVVLGVMSGAVVVLGGLLSRWSFPLHLDYLHATRYRGATRGGEVLQWLVRPRMPLVGRTVVIVDDVLDGGQTLAGIVDYCREEGARKVLSVVLVNKANPDRDPAITADFIGIEAPNRYLFGYGMDYRDCLRNAPGIFAVRGM